MDSTQGCSWRLAFTAELPINQRWSLGCQIDYMEIRTHGSHRLYNAPLNTDETWTNGVTASSNQTGVMAFIRLRI